MIPYFFVNYNIRGHEIDEVDNIFVLFRLDSIKQILILIL